jgi:hypothetical protein
MLPHLLTPVGKERLVFGGPHGMAKREAFAAGRSDTSPPPSPGNGQDECVEGVHLPGGASHGCIPFLPVKLGLDHIAVGFHVSVGEKLGVGSGVPHRNIIDPGLPLRISPWTS